jgi:hypothetical protein
MFYNIYLPEKRILTGSEPKLNADLLKILRPLQNVEMVPSLQKLFSSTLSLVGIS